MSTALALLLQLVVGGAASAAAFWVWRAAKWGTRHGHWPSHLADFALIVLLGLAVGLAVWLAGRVASRVRKATSVRFLLRYMSPSVARSGSAAWLPGPVEIGGSCCRRF
jgi:hypothetical protein